MLQLLPMDLFYKKVMNKFYKSGSFDRCDPLIKCYMGLHAINFYYDHGSDELLKEEYARIWEILDIINLTTPEDNSRRRFLDWDELLFLMQAILERPFND
jgi:hypothetical protein